MKFKKFKKGKLKAVYFGLKCPTPHTAFNILEKEYPDVETFQMAKNCYRYQINADPLSRNGAVFFKPGRSHLPEKY